MYELAAMCATCRDMSVLHVSALLFHLCLHMPSCGVSLLSQQACSIGWYEPLSAGPYKFHSIAV